MAFFHFISSIFLQNFRLFQFIDRYLFKSNYFAYFLCFYSPCSQRNFCMFSHINSKTDLPATFPEHILPPNRHTAPFFCRFFITILHFEAVFSAHFFISFRPLFLFLSFHLCKVHMHNIQQFFSSIFLHSDVKKKKKQHAFTYCFSLYIAYSAQVPSTRMTLPTLASSL